MDEDLNLGLSDYRVLVFDHSYEGQTSMLNQIRFKFWPWRTLLFNGRDIYKQTNNYKAICNLDMIDTLWEPSKKELPTQMDCSGEIFQK